MGYHKPVLYSLIGTGSTINPVDSTTYYIGGATSGAPSGTENTRRIYIPRDGFIRGASIQSYSSTVAGSNEAWAWLIRLNETTDYAFASLSLATADRFWNSTALNIPVKAGEYVSFKTTTPAWVTNPEGFLHVWRLFIETY